MIHDSENNSPTRMSIASPNPDQPGFFLLLRRKLAREDGNEDDVIDAEHQFERRERRERDPYLRV